MDIGLRIDLCQRYGSSSMQSGYGSIVECTKGFKLLLCLMFLANVETFLEQRMPRSYMVCRSTLGQDEICRMYFISNHQMSQPVCAPAQIHTTFSGRP